MIAHRFSVILLLTACCVALADDEGVQHLPAVAVSANPPLPDQYQLPQDTASIPAERFRETTNLVDTEDALKYLPSLFLRKRNDGDNQAVLATRTWGVNSSARSLVYVDGALISALIANNNSIGAPRWGLVLPESVKTVSVLYGPYAAAYPGNSLGAVVEIVTRTPQAPEAGVTQTFSEQTFSLYGTHRTYPVSQTAIWAGDRIGPWSFWVGIDNERSEAQPLNFITASTLPAGTTGGAIAFNKLGQPADVLGAGGVQTANYLSGSAKIGYEFAPGLRATWSLGVWQNRAHAEDQTYLRDAAGAPTFAGLSAFASGAYHWNEEHAMQTLSLRSMGRGLWDWQAIGTLYRFNQDTQTSPTTVAPAGAAFGRPGKVAVLSGTGWWTGDLKAAWHPQGRERTQELSFGLHADEYHLVNPTYSTPDWASPGPFSSLSSEGNGRTHTAAVWAQDVLPITQHLRLTTGFRAERWGAFDGVNVAGGTVVKQPQERRGGGSPKAMLAWSVSPRWTLSALLGRAYRFPTVAELYQLVSTGATFTAPNPNLRPETVWAGELRAEQRFDSGGSARISLFREEVRDALIPQYAALVPGSSVLSQSVMNVDRLENRGVEIVWDQAGFLGPSVDLMASVTAVDARIRSDTGQGQFGAATGKQAPYVPRWRASCAVTWRPATTWSASVAGRYAGSEYSTVDNTDVNPDTYGGFDGYFVMDVHLRWALAHRWSVSGGIDNLLNRRYYLFHPFPQRTWLAEARWTY